MNFSQIIVILLARQRIIWQTLLLTVATAILVSFLMPKTYTGTASVVVDFKQSDLITGIIVAPMIIQNEMATQIDIATSHNVALKVVGRLKLDKQTKVIEDFNKYTEGTGDIRDWLADNLLKKLNVKPSKESSVITIEYSGTDPQFAAELANTFAWAYIETNLELKMEPVRQRATWFDEQLNGLRTKMEEAQKRLTEYQRETGLLPTALDGRLDVESARLAELSSQLILAQTQNFDSVTRNRQIKEAQAKGRPGELPEILNNSLIQTLKGELSKAESKLEEISGRVDRNHPEYASAQAEVRKLKQKIAAEIETARGSMEYVTSQTQQRENELKNALALQKTHVLELKQQRDRSDLLTQELARTQSALDAATQRANQIKLESKLNQTNIAILNPAIVPLEPTKPKIILNIAIAIFLGGLLGIGFGLLSEKLDTRIRSVEDITVTLGLPVLAVIPALPKGKSSGLFRRKHAV